MPEIPFWVKSPDYERVSFLSIENSTHEFFLSLISNLFHLLQCVFNFMILGTVVVGSAGRLVKQIYS